MQKDFGLEGMLFNVDSVMVSVENGEPTQHIEITPIEGYMVGNKFVIGEVKFTDTVHDNGDGEVKFEVAFSDVTPEESNELVVKYSDEIRKIMTSILYDVFNFVSNEMNNT